MKKSLLFLLLLALPVITFAQSDIGFYGVGGRLAYVMPEDPIESTIGFGAIADLGTITPDIALEAFVDYWGKTYDWGGGFETKFSVISIGAVAKYYFETNSSFEPYVAGGLGFNISSAKTTSPSVSYGGVVYSAGGETSDSSTDIGIVLEGGATKELSPTLDGTASLKYVISDVDYFGIFVGVMYKLGK